jgi:hypothetical protein
MKTLLGLLRLRESNRSARAKRLVEQRKNEGPIYLYNADLLKGKERESIRDLIRLQQRATWRCSSLSSVILLVP